MAARFAPFAVASLAVSLLLAGCAAGGDYPSLLPRPAEKADATPAPPPAPPPVQSADPALGSRLSGLIAQANQGQQQFEAAIAGTNAAVARADTAGSESWIEAQQAVSRLESERSPTMVALAELDGIARARAEAGIATAETDLAAIAAAEEQVRTLADAQEKEISRLGSALPQP